MPHSPAARKPAGKQPARALQRVDATFRESVLIAAYHHGAVVGPQIQRGFPLTEAFRKRPLYALIDKDIVACAVHEDNLAHCHAIII